jgi:hypothetical protein
MTVLTLSVWRRTGARRRVIPARTLLFNFGWCQTAFNPTGRNGTVPRNFRIRV